MKSTSYTDQDIMKLEDDVLGLKVTVHVLVQLLAKSSNDDLNFLLENLGFQANHFEREFPDFPGTIETLDAYYKEVVRIYKETSGSNE
nr:hypothetical protein [Klebsiella oxytoca]